MRLTAEKEERLDVFLAREMPQHSRSTIAKSIAAGLVTVDDRQRKASFKVSNGNIVHFELAEEVVSDSIEPSEIPVSVPYQDEYLLVIDKPSGLSTHPSPTSHEPTLVNALVGMSLKLSDEAGSFRPGIVHRLDKETSGLMLVAKTNAVHRKLQEAIQKREVERKYWAWVRGAPKQESFTIRSHLGRHPKNRKKQAVVAETAADARLAVTHCSLQWTSQGVSKIECKLETGRTHQIRVHLAAVGLPILGDGTYGVEYPGLARQALHAVKLSFSHPISGEQISLEAPVPTDLAMVDSL